MPNQPSVPAPLPWYDDRIKEIRSEDPSPWAPIGNSIPTPWDDDPKTVYDTPRKIYEYLDARVWKQDAAKRAASIVMYHCIRGIKTTGIFVGPSGCGKTHIWRCLREIFPEKISIADGSNITMDGWQGSKKWGDLLRFPAAWSGDPCILVIDEADKMFAQKYTSHGENVSHAIQSEGLTILEGTTVDIKDGPVTRKVDTSKISFILCGAFSAKANDLAAQISHRHIGFGAAQPDAALPYETGLTEQDLIDFGVMPEFLGRIQRIVNLEPMTAGDYFRMTEAPHGLLWQLQRQYGMEIRIAPERRRELAEHAYHTGLGVRGMEGQIRQLIDNAIFDDCERQSLEL